MSEDTPLHIELNTFLKKMNVASSGGEAKQIIRSGVVKVNGEVDTRNKRKLILKDIVTVEDKTFEVTET
jgi:ribosome-associated protein